MPTSATNWRKLLAKLRRYCAPIALRRAFGPVRRPRQRRVLVPLTSSMIVGLVAMFAATLIVWTMTRQLFHERNLAVFDALADDSATALARRMETYRQILDGGAAIVAADDDLTRTDWLNYYRVNRLESLPGLKGIGFIEPVERGTEAAFVQRSRAAGMPRFAVHPAATSTDRMVVKFIEPIAANLAAVGLDIGFEARRRNAAEAARDTGEARITERITLVQDQQKTPGFLLIRPVYRRGAVHSTPQERRSALRGWVFAPFLASGLVADLTANQGKLFSVTVRTSDLNDPVGQIFSDRHRRRQAGFSSTRTIPVMGQSWTVTWDSTELFEASANTNEPDLVLGAGLLLTLCFGFLLHSYARRHADVRAQVEAKKRGRDQAIAAFFESERRFGDLAGLSPGGIIRSDSFGFCIYVNESWLTLTGLSASEALGAGWISAIHNSERDAFQRDWQQAVAGGTEHRATFRFMHPDGTSRWADMITRPELGIGGDIRGFISVAMDATDRMELERALQAARRQAEAAVEAKSSFLANMSHEIRTPMNGVIGFTELILKSKLSEEQRRQIQLIAESGRSMMRLLNDILDLSKVEAGQMKITIEPVDLHQLVSSSVSLMAALADDKGIGLSCEIAADVPPFVSSDSMRLRQVLLNLLGNAVKFTSTGEVVLRIRLAPDNPHKLRFEVQDTGIGIAQDRQAVIFDQFIQADASITRDHGGTGLGLTISSRLTHLLGGKLSLASSLGRGSTFAITLPLIIARPAITATGPDGGNRAERRRAPRRPRCCRILLVEDHDINQMLMTDMLNQMGIDVEVAGNGAIAVQMVTAPDQPAGWFDLVLMDMNMPVMNGVDAAYAIRAAGLAAAALPIVALTANAFDEDVASCLAAGMQAHLAKPIDAVHLEQAINRWAKQTPDLIATVAAAAITQTPALSLNQRYQERKLDTIGSVQQLVQSADFAGVQVQAVADKLHKLAGTAGMFGDAELGEWARTLERDLQSTDRHNIAGRVKAAIISVQALSQAA